VVGSSAGAEKTKPKRQANSQPAKRADALVRPEAEKLWEHAELEAIGFEEIGSKTD
jgi:hypothetical protein